jgi:hypothetical protein
MLPDTCRSYKRDAPRLTLLYQHTCPYPLGPRQHSGSHPDTTNARKEWTRWSL